MSGFVGAVRKACDNVHGDSFHKNLSEKGLIEFMLLGLDFPKQFSAGLSQLPLKSTEVIPPKSMKEQSVADPESF